MLNLAKFVPKPPFLTKIKTMTLGIEISTLELFFVQIFVKIGVVSKFQQICTSNDMALRVIWD